MGSHILIAEDSPSQRELLVYLCRQIPDCTTHEASDGRWAALLAQKIPDLDLVITDINMPGLDGIGLVQELSRRVKLPSLLLLSGHMPELLLGCSKAAEALGFSGISYLAKPLEPAIIMREVQKLLAYQKTETKTNHHFSLAEIFAGLAQNQFCAYYQPIFCQQSLQAVQIEALARWRHPVMGILGPSTFIERLENDGFILLLTRRIVQTSLDLITRQPWARHLRLSINISRGILADNDFFEWLLKEVEARALHPSQIVLEITETMTFHDLGNTLAALLRLRMKGFELSLDDFGSGHTNLEQLKSLPITELKLDRSMIKDISMSSRGQKILDGTIQIARELNLRMVAEGIDNIADRNYLQQRYPYLELQGFLFSKPVSATRLPSFLKASPGDAGAEIA